MGGKMGLQKAILEGKLALYPWQIFGKNPVEMEWKAVLISNEATEIFLCQVRKKLRIYKPFIGGQPPVNGLRVN